MKAILLSVLCTLTLNVQSMDVKKDTINKYVIDKQVIERFDGTQLEGKTISKYIIAYRNVGNVVEKNHVIITENKSFSLNGKSQEPGLVEVTLLICMSAIWVQCPVLFLPESPSRCTFWGGCSG